MSKNRLYFLSKETAFPRVTKCHVFWTNAYSFLELCKFLSVYSIALTANCHACKFSLKYSHPLQEESYIKQHTNLLLEGHKLTPVLVHHPMRSHLLQQLWVQAGQLEKTTRIIQFCSRSSAPLTSGN